jgi:hypothetical protein
MRQSGKRRRVKASLQSGVLKPPSSGLEQPSLESQIEQSQTDADLAARWVHLADEALRSNKTGRKKLRPPTLAS